MTSSSASALKAVPPPRATGDTLLRTTLYPLFLMLAAPPGVQFVWVVCYHHAGSVRSALATPPRELWAQFPSASLEAAGVAAAFLLAQLALLLVVPGATFTAIPTPMGNRPRYTLNGVRCWALTHAALLAGARLGLWRLAALYDLFGPLLAVLNRFALVATVLLYARGIYAPTNSDSGATGHGVVWDMWHGTELHPEVCGVSLKQLVNCRFAMMGWSVAIVCFAAHQAEQQGGAVANSTAVSLALQLAYIVKFFCWEGGYFNSVDIIHDRFGFYIFWGCTAFLPSIYTLTSYFLAAHPVALPRPVAGAVLAAGLAALACNYWTDVQRQAFRAAGGADPVWGRPARYVVAEYDTGDGKRRRSLLLASGWWGVARHINYVFEILLALCWSVPAGTAGLIPYVYVTFLTILLLDRAYRDEIRCSLKYGKYYDEYCRMVPWRMVPGVY